MICENCNERFNDVLGCGLILEEIHCGYCGHLIFILAHICEYGNVEWKGNCACAQRAKRRRRQRFNTLA